MAAVAMPSDSTQIQELRRPAGHPVDGAFAIRTIAVPLDGSAYARAALRPAQALAARLDAELVLISAATPASIPGVEADLAADLGETDAVMLLREAASLIREKGIRVRELVVAGPVVTSPADAILAAADEVGAGLIVMGTHGRTGVSRALMGSVAEAVVARSQAPVLLVHPHYGGREHDGSMAWLGWEGAALNASRSGAPIIPLRLLVALDGSPESEAALGPTARLARSLGAQVSLVRVEHSRSLDGRNTAVATHSAAAYLQRASLALQDAGVSPDAIRLAVRIGSVPETLLDQAAREQATLLVMATHGRRGLPRLLLGSTAAQVVAHARLPVLVVRAGLSAASDTAGGSAPMAMNG